MCHRRTDAASGGRRHRPYREVWEGWAWWRSLGAGGRRHRRKIERRLARHLYASALIDELELAHDPAGARHRDVEDIGGADGAHRPRTAHLPAVDDEAAALARTEPGARADPCVVDGDRLGAR